MFVAQNIFHSLATMYVLRFLCYTLLLEMEILMPVTSAVWFVYTSLVHAVFTRH